MTDELDDDTTSGLTRRTFVASGVAVGAAVVWSSPFPFADAPIGQAAEPRQGVTGGTTGPTGATGGTGNTGNTGNTGGNGGNKKAVITIKAKRRLVEKAGNIVTVAVAVAGGKKAFNGKVKLEAVIKGKTRAIGSARFTTAAGGGTARVKVTLNKAGRKLSEDRKNVPVRITVSGGSSTPKRKAVILKTLD